MASETYEFLKKIAKGEEVNRWSYPDKLINHIYYTKGKSPKVEITFDDDDDFLEVLGVTDDDDLYMWRRFMGRYSYDYDFDMWRYEEDWKDGYVVESFVGENIELTNKILKLINPNLQLGNNNDVDNSDIARTLNIEFGDEVSDITYEYGRYNEECVSRAIQKVLNEETDNPFTNFGVIQKQNGYKFVTSVNILLNLYKMLNAEDEDLKGMLTLLYENYGNKDIGGWYDLEYNVWCDDYDTEGFQDEVNRILNKMLEKAEEEFEGVDREEYDKIYDTVMGLGGFNKLIKLPEKGIEVFFYKFDTNTNKLYFDLYKGNKKETRSVDNLEDLNLQLYHPELFESLRKNIFKQDLILEFNSLRKMMGLSLLVEQVTPATRRVLKLAGFTDSSIDNLVKQGIDLSDLSKISDEFASMGIKTMEDWQTLASKQNIDLKTATDDQILKLIDSTPNLKKSIQKAFSDKVLEKTNELLSKADVKTFLPANMQTEVTTVMSKELTDENSDIIVKLVDTQLGKLDQLFTNLKKSKTEIPEPLQKLYDNLKNKKSDATNFKQNKTNKRPTINLDTTQGGKLDTNKPEKSNITTPKEPNFLEPFKPRNYEWIYGGDLKNHVGEFKSDWFGEDAIDFSKLEGKYDNLIEPGEEFPEDVIYQSLITDIKFGLNRLKEGNISNTWDDFPIGGFERYGIDNFRAWVKNLYETNRLTNIEIDKDGVPFKFTIEPKSKKVQPAVLTGELPKSNFDEKMRWELKQIADDPSLTPEEKYKKTLEKTNYYWRMKNVKRDVKKLEDKKGAEFVLDDNGNFVLDPDYKPEPWQQDPDLNESIIKNINKIKRLL